MTEPEVKPEVIPQPIEEETNGVNPEVSKTSPVAEKPSKKEKKSKKYLSPHHPNELSREKKSKKHRSKSRSDSASTDESRDQKDSESKSRSRSHRKKKSKKSRKHRKRSDRSESKSNSRSRSRSRSSRKRDSRKHRRHDDYDDRRRKHRSSRDRDNHRRDRNHEKNHRKERESSKRRDRDDGRSRTRSPHPLLGNKKPQDVPLKYTKIDDANKSKMFWDGFQWVTKTSATGVTADPSLLTQTKKMRRLLISNLPLQLGLGEKEIGEFVTKFIIENYLNDDGNFQPVKEVIVDTVKNSATIELSSVEEAGRLAKVEAIKILGHNCRVSKAGESRFEQEKTLGNLVAAAQTAAHASAAAIAAMNMLQKKDGTTAFTLSKLNLFGNVSKNLKLTNLISPEEAKTMSAPDLDGVREDMVEEFGKSGKILDSFIVKPEKAASGAEAGTVFIVFETGENAEKAMNAMANKQYNGNAMRIIFVDDETFQKSFAHLKA